MDIKHNAEQRRFEIEVDGYEAHVAYSIHDNGLDIRHTIVPSEIGGRGIASALVKAAYDFALENALKVYESLESDSLLPFQYLKEVMLG